MCARGATETFEALMSYLTMYRSRVDGGEENEMGVGVDNIVTVD